VVFRKSAQQALAELLSCCGMDDRSIANMDLQQRELAWKRTIRSTDVDH
jgi:hypothetical protein